MVDSPLAPSSGGTSEEPEREPLALPTTLGWLAQIKAAPVLALLRDPEFALISMRAFTGFRVNAQGYANPIVRSRLAQEAIKDDKFADKLRALAEEPTPASPTLPKREDRSEERAQGRWVPPLANRPCAASATGASGSGMRRGADWPKPKSV